MVSARCSKAFSVSTKASSSSSSTRYRITDPSLYRLIPASARNTYLVPHIEPQLAQADVTTRRARRRFVLRLRASPPKREQTWKQQHRTIRARGCPTLVRGETLPLEVLRPHC